MENIVGIFHSITGAEQAVEDLSQRGIPQSAITLLSRDEPLRRKAPATHEKEVSKVEQASHNSVDAGKKTGEVLGVVIGGSAGFAAGATAAALLIPGLGVIWGLGLGAAALLGLGGGAAGAKLGSSIESDVDAGASPEQADFYRRLLHRGYSLVIADVRGGSDISTVREVFRQRGSEDVEVARKELGEAA